MMSRRDKLIEYTDQHQYVFLIITIVGLLVLYPFVVDLPTSEFWVHIMITLTLLTGLYAASTHKKFVFLSIFLGIFSLLFNWIEYLYVDNTIIILFSLFTGLTFFLFIAYNIIITLHNEKRITSHLIFGGIAGYLLLGLIGTFIFSIIEIYSPGSFSLDISRSQRFPEFIYYSYVSLTTLGYGDIIPVSHHARAWSLLLTIAGQMYLAILIGVIVGKYIRIEWTSMIRHQRKQEQFTKRKLEDIDEMLHEHWEH